MNLGDKCPHCGMIATQRATDRMRGKKAVDPCLGRLPGVMHACCGHGDGLEAYAILGPYEPGTMVSLVPQDTIASLYFSEASRFFAKVLGK